MKKKTLTVLFALAALTAGAQTKLDLQSRMLLMDLRGEVEAAAKRSGKPFKALAQEKTVSVTVLMNDGVDAAALADKGFGIRASREEVGVVTLPLSRIDELSGMADVKSISYGAKYTPRLTECHKLTGVDKIHSGEGLTLPYKGKGILIADVDKGFDPTHAFFLDKDGKTRVKYYSKGDKSYTTQEDIMSAGTDASDSFHSAHVLGIAAGNYSDADFTISGVAPEADIAMANYRTGTTEDIIAETEKIVKFSKELKEPLVINYSLGNNVGPHDGSDEFVTYANKLIASGDAIVCVSAGNEGTYPIVQKHTMQSDDDTMTAYMYSYGYLYEPMCLIIGEGSDAFDVSFVIFDAYSQKVLKTYDPSVNQLAAEGENADADFAKYFTGKAYKMSEKEKTRDRYDTMVMMKNGEALESGVLLGYVVKGKKGRNFLAYSSGDTWLVKGMTDTSLIRADGVTSDGSINTLATGMNGISVGSYNNRDKGVYADGTAYSYVDFQETNKLGDVSSFSSWGTVDGVNYPHITAPGCLVISALTEDYFNSIKSEKERKYTNCVTLNGRKNYWTVEQGTSMAAPYVSGVAALWLEADPTLTMAQIKEISGSTAIKDDFVKNTKYPVQFGAGKIDAYSGLKKVLERKSTGLRAVDADKDMLFRSTGDNAYEAYVAGETAITVNIYDMSGSRVYSRRTAGNSVEFSTASLPKGVYAVELCGSKTSHKVKIAVK